MLQLPELPALSSESTANIGILNVSTLLRRQPRIALMLMRDAGYCAQRKHPAFTAPRIRNECNEYCGDTR